MLDRASADVHRSSATGSRGGSRLAQVFVAAAGLMGAAGVGVGAAAAHMGGGETARTASEYLLVHAVAVVGASALSFSVGRGSVLFLAAIALMIVGAVLFGGALAIAGLWNLRPVPMAAPAGGMCLIAAWLLVSVAAASAVVRRW